MLAHLPGYLGQGGAVAAAGGLRGRFFRAATE